MANVSAPTPLVFAGAGICLLAGYLVGVVVGPETPTATEAIVASYDPATRELCLEGDEVEGAAGAEGQRLCGTWSKGAGSRGPRVGDRFRFLTLETDRDPDTEAGAAVVIYGDVIG